MVGPVPQHQIILAAAAAARVLRGVFQLPTVSITALVAMVSKAQLLARQSFMQAAAAADGRVV
jgi:hypothetical protein